MLNNVVYLPPSLPPSLSLSLTLSFSLSLFLSPLFLSYELVSETK